MRCYNLMKKGIFIELDDQHVFSGNIIGLLNRNRYFPGFSIAKSNLSLAITDNCQGCKTKLPAALHYFGNTLYVNKPLYPFTFILLIHF